MKAPMMKPPGGADSPQMHGVKPHLHMQKLHIGGKSAFGGMGAGAFDPTNAMPGAPGGAAFPGAADTMGAAGGDAGE